MSLPLLVAKRIGPRIALAQANSRALSITPQKAAGYWNKDWRPKDNPPETEEERRAAAKKYGLIPEDYETYPNDGTGYGDYPKLPLVTAEDRDPSALYDFPEFKRNYGEPMHVDFDLVEEVRWNANARFQVPPHMMLVWFFGTMIGTWTLFQLCEYVRIAPVRQMPRQFPDGPRKYYTFEVEPVE